MKPTDKRLLTFFILIASAYMAFAQTLFYIARISKEDFAKALNSKFVFVYDIWRDSVVENAITDRIIRDAKQRFEKLDSIIQPWNTIYPRLHFGLMTVCYIFHSLRQMARWYI